jgi:aryl-alcohol dehydrogenase (NADP+)
LALDQGMALVPWSPLKNGFLSGKYRRDAEVTDSARVAFVGGPTDAEFTVIDAVAGVAAALETSSAAVSLAWLLARPGTVVPILGARRVEHLRDNLAALGVRLDREHLDALAEVSQPTLNYPAPMHGEMRAMLQFAGTTVDGESSTVYPPLEQSDVRY